MHHDAFTWLNAIPGLEHTPNHILGAILVFALLVGLGFLAFRSIRNQTIEESLVPSPRFTLRNFLEVIIEKLYGLVETVMGEKAAKEYFPVIGTLFIFVFTSNILGLIPGFLPPTDNINTTLAAGFFVFLFYNIQGFRKNGWNYLKHFFGPVWYLAPLMFVIELVSHFFRPVSLSLRLSGNMIGDHAVLSVFLDLVPLVIPVIFYGLGLFVCFIQAFVFCLLTMVYLNLSIAHDH